MFDNVENSLMAYRAEIWKWKKSSDRKSARKIYKINKMSAFKIPGTILV